MSNQIEESKSEKICISEIVVIINRFILGSESRLESLNIGLNELNLIHKLNDEPRIELIDILTKEPKKCILNTAEYISNGKNLKIKPIDLSLKGKCIAYCSDLPFGIICPTSYVNIATMSIISSDKKINKNYF